MPLRDLLGVAVLTGLLALLPSRPVPAEALHTGDLVVAGKETIGRLDPVTGEQDLILGPDLFRPGKIAIGPRGAIFVADPGNAGVARVDPTSGERSLVATVEFSPAYPGLAIDRRGDLLVGSGRSLLRIDPATGAQTTVVADLCALLGGDSECFPAGIAVDERDGIFVAVSCSSSACEPIEAAPALATERPPALLRIDAKTGGVALVASLDALEIGGIAIDDRGDVLLADGLEVLRVDPDTGAQEIVHRVFGAQDVAIDAQGFLFVVASAPPFFPQLLRIDPAAGSSTPIPAPGLVEARGIAVDDLRGDLLVTDAVRRLIFRVDPGSGEASVLSARKPPRLRAVDVAVEARADLLVTDSLSTSIRRLDPETQRLTTVSTLGGFATDPVGFAWAPLAIGTKGQIFAIDASQESILRIDPGTGLQTTISTGPELSAAAGIAVREDGDLLVTLGYASFPPDSRILRVDPRTGARTLFSSGGPLSFPGFVASDPTDGTALVLDDGTLLRVDLATGAVALLSDQIGLNGRGIVANGQGELFVSVPAAILRIDPDTGEAQPLSAGGFLRAPFGLAIDAEGNLIAADAEAEAVIHVDSVAGAQTRISFGGLLRRPRAVAIGPQGSLLVVDPGAEAVLGIDPATGDQAVIASGGRLDRGTDIAVAPNGAVLVSTAFPSALLRVDVASGAQSVVSSEGSLGFPGGIAIGAEGEVLVATGRVLLRVDAVTGSQTLIAGSRFLSLHGIALDPDDDVIVTDFFLDGVIRIDADTGLQTAYYLAPDFLGPRGVAVDSAGNVFAAMSGSDSVARIEPDTGASTLIPTLDEPSALAIVPLVVRIDVKPGSSGNVIHPLSRGVVPVAIFGSDEFAVSEVDPTTLGFGPGRAPLAHRNGPHRRDVDRDGIGDLLAHFRTEEAGLAPGDPVACVAGELLDGTRFESCDSIRTVPACGLGYELALLLPALMALRQRRAGRRRN